MLNLLQLKHNYDKSYIKGPSNPINNPSMPDRNQLLHAEFSFANGYDFERLAYSQTRARDDYKLLWASKLLDKKTFEHSSLIKSSLNDKKHEIFASIFKERTPTCEDDNQSNKLNHQPDQKLLHNAIPKPKTPPLRLPLNTIRHKRSVSTNASPAKSRDSDDEPGPDLDKFYQYQQSIVEKRQKLNQVYESPHVKDLERKYRLKFPANFHIPGSPTYILPVEAVNDLRKRKASSFSPRPNKACLATDSTITSPDKNSELSKSTRSTITANYRHPKTKILQKLQKSSPKKEPAEIFTSPVKKKENNIYTRRRFSNLQLLDKHLISEKDGSNNPNQIMKRPTSQVKNNVNGAKTERTKLVEDQSFDTSGVFNSSSVGIPISQSIGYPRVDVLTPNDVLKVEYNLDKERILGKNFEPVNGRFHLNSTANTFKTSVTNKNKDASFGSGSAVLD